MINEIIRHYDLLIDEGNDPVHDPEPLQAYMDGWDGQLFLDALQLDGSQRVLEIGVGTGRLALRTAPLCGRLTGIDVSAKTLRRARENLSACLNVTLVEGDFLTWDCQAQYDVIYSSLTFMHIREKAAAITKVAGLLKKGGRVVLSLDKSQEHVLDYGTRRVTIYPDTPAEITACLRNAGLTVLPQQETEFAYILTAYKEGDDA